MKLTERDFDELQAEVIKGNHAHEHDRQGQHFNRRLFLIMHQREVRETGLCRRRLTTGFAKDTEDVADDTGDGALEPKERERERMATMNK